MNDMRCGTLSKINDLELDSQIEPSDCVKPVLRL